MGADQASTEIGLEARNHPLGITALVEASDLAHRCPPAIGALLVILGDTQHTLTFATSPRTLATQLLTVPEIPPGRCCAQ